jgi:antitoxin YefM
MPIKTTYSSARANFAKLWDEVTENKEVVVIDRRGAEPVALVSASELAGLLETAHLVRSPKNAKRLLKALGRAKARSTPPMDVNALWKEIGLEREG